METKSRPMQHKEKKKTESFFFPHGLETDNLKQQNILKQQKRFIFFHFLDYMCKNDYETKAYDGGRYCFLFKNI
jgi:hypothetical protein